MNLFKTKVFVFLFNFIFVFIGIYKSDVLILKIHSIGFLVMMLIAYFDDYIAEKIVDIFFPKPKGV